VTPADFLAEYIDGALVVAVIALVIVVCSRIRQVIHGRHASEQPDDGGWISVDALLHAPSAPRAPVGPIGAPTSVGPAGSSPRHRSSQL
jgi:hypothetical protein